MPAQMTVRDLKEAIEDLPDDMPVILSVSSAMASSTSRLLNCAVVACRSCRTTPHATTLISPNPSGSTAVDHHTGSDVVLVSEVSAAAAPNKNTP